MDHLHYIVQMMAQLGDILFESLKNLTQKHYATYWNQLRNNRHYKDVPHVQHNLTRPIPWSHTEIKALKALLHQRVTIPSEIKGTFQSFFLPNCVLKSFFYTCFVYHRNNFQLF